MRSNFDKTGLKFTIKFISGIFLLYFFVSFSSQTIFDFLLSGQSQISGAGDENLALVIVPEIQEEPGPKPIVLGFVGDIMLDRGVNKIVSSYKGGDFDTVFNQSRMELSSLDLLFGNLEGPVSDKGRDLGGLYSFRMDPAVVDSLANASFDVLSFSNNHSGDWGEEALDDTVRRLRNAGIEVVGAGLSAEEAYAPIIVSVRNTEVGLLSFTESAGMYRGPKVALANEARIRSGVESLKENGNVDFIVVHFHFGDEYQSKPNDQQRKLARLAIDSGADLVVGTHPHVTQTVERYNGGLIAYSLGNFVFDQHFSEETMRGWLLKTYLSDGKLSEVEICDTRLNSLFQPVIFPCVSI